MKLYAVIGAGGFGREVIPLAHAMLKEQLSQSDYQLVFVDKNIPASLINNHIVMSFEEFFAHSATEKFFNIAIANSEIRKNIAELMSAKNIQPFRISAFNYIDLGSNDIGEGAIFCHFTMVTANAKIGRFFHANIYSYVAHDCVIGDYVTFAPNVHCNGNVIIEDNVYVGTGVIIREGTPDKPLVIGKGAVLGMGAVVTKNIQPYEIVIGNPARLFKRNEMTSA
jgi:sugar O-acyltransferase (sialic acid O-acetyltransferase NeuD family)